jgi:hypothetical protein
MSAELPKSDKYLLSHVFGRLTVMQKAVRQSEHLSSKCLQDQLNSLVAALRPDELHEAAVR